MEIEQSPPPDEAAQIHIHAGKYTSYVGLSKLFKDLRVPRREPIPLRPQRQNCTETASAQIVDNPKAPRNKSSLTSIDGHPTIELADQCYAIPTKPVAPEYMHLWESQIKDRLSDELAQCIRAERCQLEFFVVSEKKKGWIGDTKGWTGPCIVLSVWDEKTCHSENGRRRTRRRAQKMVGSLQSMQNCQFPCKVVIDTISLLAHRSEPTSCPGATVNADYDRETVAFAGHLINESDNGARECTLGGLIKVGSTVFGLTVAHPFCSLQNGVSELPSIFISQNAAEDTDEGSSDDIDDNLSDDVDDSVSDDTVDNLTDDTDVHTVYSSLDSPATEASRSEREYPNVAPTASEEAVAIAPVDHASFESQAQFRSYESSNFFGRIWAQSLQTEDRYEENVADLDWALVDLDSSTPLLSNSYIRLDTSCTTQIEACGTCDLEPNSEVVVLGGKSGPTQGFIGQKNIDLRIEGRKFVVTQIVLNQTLQIGDSGAWVVRDQMAVGCIVAGRKLLPVAYTVPIASVFDHIVQHSEGQQISVARVDFIKEYAGGHKDTSEKNLPDNSRARRDESFAHSSLSTHSSIRMQSHNQIQHVIENPPKPTSQKVQLNEKNERRLVPFNIDSEAQTTQQQPSLSPAINHTPPLIDTTIRITFDTPFDPRNPKNWTLRWRWFTIAIMILFLFSV
ncbi:MAG: hypothetical protein Q9160_006881 [Pyrenula sp. 1 TL-2023]